MKDFITNILKPLAKSPELYALLLVLLLIGGVRLAVVYVDSGKPMPKIEAIKK